MKRKKLLAGLTTFAMTATMLLSPIGSMGIRAEEGGGTVIANDETGIPDAALYDAILRLADSTSNGGNADGILTTDEAEKLERLTVNFFNSGFVSNLSGIGHCKNLSSVEVDINAMGFDGDRITDISPLSDLPNLTNLNIRGNQVTDISVLSGMSNLTSLNISGNQVTDISVLSGMSNLTSLDISNNQLAEIKLSKLPNLTTLELKGNPADKLTLENLPKLESLDLSWAGFTKLTMNGLSGLKSLDLRYDGITDISGLSGMTSLTSLDLGGNQVTDISGLSGMTSLTSLDLGGNQVTDISPLSGMKNLTKLHLGGNVVKDISPLSGLTNLTELHLDYNVIKDISPLSGLINLTSLYLSGNQVEDINPLSGLINLTSLYLSGNQVEDISVLQNLPELCSANRLDLSNNKITDISVLSKFTNLTDLYLEGNKITDISVLSNLTNLRTLHLRDNKIKDISALQYLTNLGFDYYDNYEFGLDLGNNQITDVSALSGLTNVRGLNVSNNQITDVSALSGLTELSSLNVSNNQITDTSVLSGLTNVTSLNVSNNQIADISALSGLTGLTRLNLSNNRITDISAIQHLTNLHGGDDMGLDVSNNQITDVSALASLTNLYSLDIRGNKITDISCLEDLFLNHNLVTLRSEGNDIKDFPCYVEYDKEVEIRYLSDKDRKRIMEIFNLSEYDGKVICLDGDEDYNVKYVTPNNNNPNYYWDTSAYGNTYAYASCDIDRNEKGELVLGNNYGGRKYIHGNEAVVGFYDYEAFGSQWGGNDFGLHVLDNQETCWLIYRGDISASGLEFTDKVEKAAKIVPFSKKADTWNRSLEIGYQVLKEGVLSEDDCKAFQNNLDFTSDDGKVDLIPSEGAKYSINLDASTYEKEDIESVQICYYKMSRAENGKLGFGDLSCEDRLVFNMGTIDWRAYDSYPQIRDDGGLLTDVYVDNIEDCSFYIPGRDDVPAGTTLIQVRVRTLDGNVHCSNITYDDEDLKELFQFTELKEPNDDNTGGDNPGDNNTVNMGDMDGNKKVDLNDAKILLKGAVGIITLTEEQIKLGDINNDKKINLNDAKLLLRIAVGIK